MEPHITVLTVAAPDMGKGQVGEFVESIPNNPANLPETITALFYSRQEPPVLLHRMELKFKCLLNPFHRNNGGQTYDCGCELIATQGDFSMRIFARAERSVAHRSRAKHGSFVCFLRGNEYTFAPTGRSTDCRLEVKMPGFLWKDQVSSINAPAPKHASTFLLPQFQSVHVPTVVRPPHPSPVSVPSAMRAGIDVGSWVNSAVPNVSSPLSSSLLGMQPSPSMLYPPQMMYQMDVNRLLMSPLMHHSMSMGSLPLSLTMPSSVSSSVPASAPAETKLSYSSYHTQLSAVHHSPVAPQSVMVETAGRKRPLMENTNVGAQSRNVRPKSNESAADDASSDTEMTLIKSVPENSTLSSPAPSSPGGALSDTSSHEGDLIRTASTDFPLHMVPERHRARKGVSLLLPRYVYEDTAPSIPATGVVATYTLDADLAGDLQHGSFKQRQNSLFIQGVEGDEEVFRIEFRVAKTSTLEKERRVKKAGASKDIETSLGSVSCFRFVWKGGRRLEGGKPRRSPPVGDTSKPSVNDGDVIMAAGTLPSPQTPTPTAQRPWAVIDVENKVLHPSFTSRPQFSCLRLEQSSTAGTTPLYTLRCISSSAALQLRIIDCTNTPFSQQPSILTRVDTLPSPSIVSASNGEAAPSAFVPSAAERKHLDSLATFYEQDVRSHRDACVELVSQHPSGAWTLLLLKDKELLASTLRHVRLWTMFYHDVHSELFSGYITLDGLRSMPAFGSPEAVWTFLYISETVRNVELRFSLRDARDVRTGVLFQFFSRAYSEQLYQNLFGKPLSIFGMAHVEDKILLEQARLKQILHSVTEAGSGASDSLWTEQYSAAACVGAH